MHQQEQQITLWRSLDKHVFVPKDGVVKLVRNKENFKKVVGTGKGGAGRLLKTLTSRTAVIGTKFSSR